MNYGRFFRLNQSLSKVVDGVAIYDYIELPAYFGPSEENEMSPKYPVSVTITSDSVRFRLHYSVYKVETDLNSEYGYSVDDIHQAMDGSTKGIKMAHMEEVIFELPYINDATDRLTSTIKELYSTKFPQRIDDNRAEGLNSSGGRFLEQLIRRRFPQEGEEKTDSIENSLYNSMREALDKLPSYSSLWLMDLIRCEKKDQHIDVYEKGMGKEDNDRDIVGFLRKLLLDFMFDLKHSDVFQNSRYYQTMHSGLMSDFYFSALMHKCEYYYYRDLVTEEMRKEDGMTVDDKKRILMLYGDNLRKSEELWTQDIMNPASEKYFDYSFGNTPKAKKEEKESTQETCKSLKNLIDRILVKIFVLEDNQLIKRDSWFAEPEEEMRRVCFPMDDEDDFKHLCNVELMVNYLRVSNSEQFALTEYVNNNKEKISRWFLRRYDFNDVCHLHLSRWANLISFSLLFILILLFVSYNTFIDNYIKNVNNHPYLPMWGALASLFFMSLLLIKRKCKNRKHSVSMLSTYIEQNSTRLLNLVVLLVIFTIGIHWGSFFWVILALFIICLLFPRSRDFVENILKKSTSYLHLLFPRLVASITTAWLTMSVGFDLYVAFFDSHVSWATASMILIIVFIFVMYELNRITPRSNVWKKLFRSVQLVTISYFISLVVGSIVINFLGIKYMDRGDAFESMNKTTFTVDSLTAPIKGVVNSVSWGDSKEEKEKQKKDIQQLLCDEKCQSIYIFRLGEHDIFFMRDFLIMFSFITMFMGIFLQMFIFEEKKMTEF